LSTWGTKPEFAAHDRPSIKIAATRLEGPA
jgi:hypothetical protein